MAVLPRAAPWKASKKACVCDKAQLPPKMLVAKVHAKVIHDSHGGRLRNIQVLGDPAQSLPIQLHLSCPSSQQLQPPSRSFCSVIQGKRGRTPPCDNCFRCLSLAARRRGEATCSKNLRNRIFEGRNAGSTVMFNVRDDEHSRRTSEVEALSAN